MRSQKCCQSRRHGGFAPFSTALPDSTSGWRIRTNMKPHKVRDSWQGGLVCRALPSHACQASNCSMRPLTTHLKLAVELVECYETHKQTASTIVRPFQSALQGIVGSSWQFSYGAHRAFQKLAKYQLRSPYSGLWMTSKTTLNPSGTYIRHGTTALDAGREPQGRVGCH